MFQKWKKNEKMSKEVLYIEIVKLNVPFAVKSALIY